MGIADKMTSVTLFLALWPSPWAQWKQAHLWLISPSQGNFTAAHKKFTDTVNKTPPFVPTENHPSCAVFVVYTAARAGLNIPATPRVRWHLWRRVKVCVTIKHLGPGSWQVHTLCLYRTVKVWINQQRSQLLTWFAHEHLLSRHVNKHNRKIRTKICRLLLDMVVPTTSVALRSLVSPFPLLTIRDPDPWISANPWRIT